MRCRGIGWHGRVGVKGGMGGGVAYRVARGRGEGWHRRVV